MATAFYIHTRWAIISGPPKFFVYNFHCKQQNFMKFQLEVYQDMLHHTQQKFHTFESQYWLKQCVTSSILSTYVVRNMANDAFDQKFGNHNKNQLSKCYDWKVCLAFHRLVKADFSLEIAPITRVMVIKAKGSANYGPPCRCVYVHTHLTVIELTYC